MQVYDFEGFVAVDSEDELLRRLLTVRKGEDGVFVLCHDPVNEDEPSLWIHVHRDLAKVHYFANGKGCHAGFTSWGMTPDGCEQEVDFLLPGGGGETITPAREALVPVDVAYRAAVDFLHDPALPASVSWMEL